MILSLISTGCATDVANRYYVAEKYPSKTPSEVRILTNAPMGPYMVIADFQSRGDSAQSMRRRAAKIGADAIIVSFIGGLYYTGNQWAAQDSKTNSHGRSIATAIKFTK